METPPLTRGRPSPLGPRKALKETPPLTRGRPGCRRHACPRCGNTPAYAGKTRPTGWSRTWIWKHPRLRGEDFAIVSEFNSMSETPPLTRGRQAPPGYAAPAPRNTPAYAGKTSAPARKDRPDRKHPRLRGEDLALLTTSKVLLETPPLTRGRQIANG